MKKILFSAFFVCMALCSHAQKAIYLDKNAPVEQRVEDALSRMTLEEKVKMLHAQSKFSSAGVPRLGIPDVWMSDGPHGVRPQVLWDEWKQAGWTNDSCVAFPALTCLSASWDPSLGVLYGNSIGEEGLFRGKNMLLGPGVNIFRTPLNGRNFEYMGEDPYLSAHMVVPYIEGMQETGVAACVKHFALNNQEFERLNVDVQVSDRALYEIYLPAFKAAVRKAHTIGIMPSYNLYRGQQCGHNERLLLDILKGEWQFDGVAVSDWGAVHSTAEAAMNGLDMEFGTGTDGLSASNNEYDNYYLALPYLNGLKAGKYPIENQTVTAADGSQKVVYGLDDKVRRILRFIFRTTMKERGFGSFCSDEHYAAARKIGAEGIVLLKNDAPKKGEKPLLPLDEGKKIVVVGENAYKMQTVGGGSSNLKVQHEVTPIDALRERYGEANVTYCRGYVGDTTVEYDGVITGQKLEDNRPAEVLIAEAVEAAKDADVVLFFGGLNKAYHQDSEGADRNDYALPYAQNELMEALLKANSNVVYVNVSGNPAELPWADRVPAMLQAWFLGSEAGHSMADVISGDVNPSGHLPYTWYKTLDQCGAHAAGDKAVYPGIKRGSDGTEVEEVGTSFTQGQDFWDEEYKDDIYVGYRFVDKKKLQPLFPFGYGLSYTTFAFSDAKVLDCTAKSGNLGVNGENGNGEVKVQVTVTNTGDRAGAEVAQLYVTDKKASVDRPLRELKGFQKVNLQPGESRVVTFSLQPADLAFFDETAHAWVVEPGQFEVAVGNSSRNLPVKAKFSVE